MVGLDPTNCEIAAQITCEKMSRVPPERLVRQKWIWIHELPGCAIGYYLFEDQRVPSHHECQQVYYEIMEMCAYNSRVNSGSVNVRHMPDWGQNGTAYLQSEAMYVMAPERLTL